MLRDSEKLLAISNLLCLNTDTFIISVLDWVNTNYVIQFPADKASDFYFSFSVFFGILPIFLHFT